MQNMLEGVHACIILHWDTTPSILPQASLPLRMNYLLQSLGGAQCFFPRCMLKIEYELKPSNHGGNTLGICCPN